MFNSLLYLIVNETYFSLICLKDNELEMEYVLFNSDSLLNILNKFQHLPLRIILNLGNTSVTRQEAPLLKSADKIIYLRQLQKNQLLHAQLYGCHYDREIIIEVSTPKFNMELLNNIPNPLNGIYSIPVFNKNLACVLVVTNHDIYCRHSCFINGRIEFTRFLQQGISSVAQTINFINYKYGLEVQLLNVQHCDYYFALEVAKGNGVKLVAANLHKPLNELLLQTIIKYANFIWYPMVLLLMGVFAATYYQQYQLLEIKNKNAAELAQIYQIKSKNIPSIESIVQDAKLYQEIGGIGDPVSQLQALASGLAKIYQLHWCPTKTTLYVKVQSNQSLQNHCDKINRLGYEAREIKVAQQQGEIVAKGQGVAPYDQELKGVIEIEKTKL